MLIKYCYKIFTIFKYDILFSVPKQLKIYTIEDKEEEKSLRKKSETVGSKDFEKKEFKEFLENLLHTAKNSEEQGNVPAGGIAATQVGRNIRVFYILNSETNQWQLFINPEIEPISFTKILSKEGCLSVPNIEEEVLRYKEVKIRYQDEEGKWNVQKFNDFNAVAVQHELDHLDGILFIDRIQ